MNDFKESSVNILGENELNRMKAACLGMQQELHLSPLPERRNIVSSATLRRQDEALARQGELRPDVDEDAEEVDGFVMIQLQIEVVMLPPPPTLVVLFSVGIVRHSAIR